MASEAGVAMLPPEEQGYPKLSKMCRCFGLCCSAMGKQAMRCSRRFAPGGEGDVVEPTEEVIAPQGGDGHRSYAEALHGSSSSGSGEADRLKREVARLQGELGTLEARPDQGQQDRSQAWGPPAEGGSSATDSWPALRGGTQGQGARKGGRGGPKGTEAPSRPALAAHLGRQAAAGISEAKRGQLVRWDATKGWGFIQPQKGGQNLLCHANGLVEDGDSVHQGVAVTYVEEWDDNKDSVCAGRVQAASGFLSGSRFSLPYALAPGAAVAEGLFFGSEETATSMVRFLDYMRSAQKTLDVCVFSLTNDTIARVLLTQHHAGKQVRLIVDDDQCNQQGADAMRLRRRGIHVRMDHSSFHMHNKFCIVDGVCLLNGSFNYTQAAARDNNENILVTNTPELVQAYVEQFEKLWKQFEPSEPGHTS